MPKKVNTNYLNTTESERKVAEADAYLRHLNNKTEKQKKDKIKGKIKEVVADDGVELS